MNGSPHTEDRDRYYVQAMLIVSVSKDGENDWHPLRWDEVPEWVKHPDNMARLVDGEMCQAKKLVDGESSWYKADRVVEPKIVVPS